MKILLSFLSLSLFIGAVMLAPGTEAKSATVSEALISLSALFMIGAVAVKFPKVV